MVITSTTYIQRSKKHGMVQLNSSFMGDESGLISVVWVVALVDIPASVELSVGYEPGS